MDDTPTSTRLGVVVPTLGKRNHFLIETIESIMNCRPTPRVVVIAPREVWPVIIDLFMSQFIFLDDPRTGLAECINQGIAALSDCRYITWLGDDDLMDCEGVRTSIDIMENDEEVVATFGGCTYINEDSTKIWENRSSQFATKLARFGPNLIPQPGSIVRRSSFISTGGLNNDYKWAFDLDMYLRLMKVGRVRHIPLNTGYFRWHSDSLSVRTRKQSALEASRIRVSHLPRSLQLISHIWELPIRSLVVAYGRKVARGSVR